MMTTILPKTADNSYRGYRAALWLFGVVLLLRVLMSLNSIFDGYHIATTADGIPLDTYPAAAARTAVTMFALIGLSNFIICIVCAVVLVRYRSLLPLMFALLLLHFLGSRAVLHFIPIARTGTWPGFYVNLVLFALMVAGLALSVVARRDRASDQVEVGQAAGLQRDRAR